MYSSKIFFLFVTPIARPKIDRALPRSLRRTWHFALMTQTLANEKLLWGIMSRQACAERSEIVRIFNEARAKRMKRVKRIRIEWNNVSLVVDVAIMSVAISRDSRVFSSSVFSSSVFSSSVFSSSVFSSSVFSSSVFSSSSKLVRFARSPCRPRRPDPSFASLAPQRGRSRSTGKCTASSASSRQREARWL